jgi:beta-galactosidase
VVEYRKTLVAPDDLRGKRVFVEFEGVYRDAMVFVNADFAGQRPYGYSPFIVDIGRFLRIGSANEIRVEARSHQDSRWYTGLGIYRDTWLLVGELVRISPDGLRVTTPDVDSQRAVVEVATTVDHDSVQLRTVDVTTEVRDPAGAIVGSTAARLTLLPGEPATVRPRLFIDTPLRWSTETPHLYTVRVTLTDESAVVDEATTTFGIRTLQLDPERGLRINGAPVKLRGACVHHDNGVLGAATYARAETRRVELLKQAGFNAIRMSHHTMSSAMLRACDEVGVLVVDEAFDMWTSAKNDFDYSLSFPQWWERDIEAMVAKDFNHPSVVIYSIGNEIPELGSPAGAAWSRKLAEKVRALDPTRYVTNAVNGMLTVLTELAALRQSAEGGAGINTAMTSMADMMSAISASDLVTDRTAEAFSTLDVAGMNYSESRYALDRERFPNRIIVGTETFPTRVDTNWALVQQFSHVIGDFTWTGWDYLGEVGIGRPQYIGPDERPGPLIAVYPHLLAGTGDIDITGQRRPVSYYREIVFGLRRQPFIAVERPQHHGLTFAGTPWAWRDEVASWSWSGYESSPVLVEVYSDADEVELRLNGRTLGRRPAGPRHRFRASFEAVYEPGELLAIAYTAGTETGRDLLCSADGPIQLSVESDRPRVTTAHGDLAFVTITLTDPAGTVYRSVDRTVSVEVGGAGVLLGLGSANPSTVERFDSGQRHTYDGRALAVIRPTNVGEIRLTVTAAECDQVQLIVPVDRHGQVESRLTI